MRSPRFYAERKTVFAGVCFLCAAILILHNARAQEQNAAPLLLNGGFEQGLEGWKIASPLHIGELSAEQAASGKQSLKIADNDPTVGSNVMAAHVPVQPGQYVLKGQVFPVSGTGLGIYVRFYDAKGARVGTDNDFLRAAPSVPVGKWTPWTLSAYPPENAAFLEVWFHSFNAALVTAYLDDIEVVRLDAASIKPPWPGTYKIYPQETAKLTAADVVGPDGIVYPDWRYAGVPGGIPDVPVAGRIEEFGGLADDDRDDSAALEKGAAAVGQKGGGALLLGAGVYHLDRPVLITQDGVVLRGAGAKTRLIFRYNVPAGGVRFLSPPRDTVVTPFTWVEAHADPKELQALSIFVDDQLVNTIKQNPHWGATFSLRAQGVNVTNKVPEGAHTLRAVAEYLNGRKVETTIPIRTSNQGVGGAHIPSQTGAIMFAGNVRWTPSFQVAQDGRRGDREIVLKSPGTLKAGDRIRLRAPNTPRWNALIRNAGPVLDYRRYEFLIEAVNGSTLRLNQPLRIEFPVVDGSYVQQIFPIRRCGVENLSLEQAQDLWTSGIIFSNAWECWARGVTVKKAGKFPLYGLPAKWCEIRDCVFDDAWFKGGGGTAYVGWEYAYDCLMENVETFKMRHAPQVQWTASGNVIRNSVFHDSDGQWHSGWTNENLYENCIIESAIGNGGTGYGMWASPPEDEAHGPNGPRNVVYNCDVSSPKAGLWMGGMNEGWLILYNRFKVGSGPGVYAKAASFDHIFQGNVWMLQDATQPAVYLSTPDCIGVELRDNRVLGGNGKLSGGPAKPLVERGNRIEPLTEAPRPQPAVPSIFEWQRRKGR